MRRPVLTPNVGTTNVRFRIHPNSTADPGVTSVYLKGGGDEVSAITHVSTGIWKVALTNQHTRVTARASYHLATDPAAHTAVNVYGTIEGTAADNYFYLALYVAGSLADPVYATTTWIDVDMELTDV